jgi:hypothetical protein
MNTTSKRFSFWAWLTGATRQTETRIKWVERCASCRLPLEKLHSMFASVGKESYCQACCAMIKAADTPYLQAIQGQYNEEQKRKKILLLGGNYLS